MQDEEEICEKCYCSIGVTLGLARVELNKTHIFCRPCWDDVQPRWFRGLCRKLHGQHVLAVMARCIRYERPLRAPVRRIRP
jgi:hypothetical protein